MQIITLMALMPLFLIVLGLSEVVICMKRSDSTQYLVETDYRTAKDAKAVVKAVEWWKRTNYYHIYLRSFQDSDGDGNGDLRGVIQRLDYLKEIGIDTILMAPFYSSPMKDCGYDIDDYRAIHPMFGTMQDFEDLMVEIKKRGMYMILDFVPNHSSDQHEWFKCSERAYVEPERCGKYRDYYMWIKPKLNATGQPDLTKPPTNWISCLMLDPPHWMWTFSPLRQEWYLHQFMAEQPDLNFSNPVVREEFKDIARFWLRKGADGFRVDAILHLFEDPLYRDNPPNPNYKEWQFYYNKQLHIYDRSLIESYEALADWRNIMFEPEFLDPETGLRNRVLIIEAYDPPDQLVNGYGRSPTERWADMPFGIELLERLELDNWSAKKIQGLALGWLKPVRDLGWPKENDVVSPYSNWYTGNHDNKRLVDRVGYQNAITFQWISYMLPGVPINYAGDEIHQIDLEFEKIPKKALADGDWRLAFRTPMAWNDTEPSAGFSDTPDTWLPLTPFKEKNVRTLLASPEPNQLKAFKSMSEIRTSYQPTFLFGDLVFFNNSDPWSKGESNLLALARTSPIYGNLMLIANCDPNKPAWVHLTPTESFYERELIAPPLMARILAFNYETIKNQDQVGERIKLKGFALMPSQTIVIRY